MLDRIKKIVKSHKDSDLICFWFVRHALSEGNALDDTCPVMHDTPLTEEGRKEALRIVRYFKDNNVCVTDVYSSPQVRSRETAEAVARAFGINVKVKEGLAERNWGEWKDLRWMEVSNRLDKLSLEDRYTFIPPHGESWKQMEQRLLSTLTVIAEENSVKEDVVIVMHRGGLRAVLPLFARVGIEKHAEFSVSTGTLSKFSFCKDSFDFIGFAPKDE